MIPLFTVWTSLAGAQSAPASAAPATDVPVAEVPSSEESGPIPGIPPGPAPPAEQVQNLSYQIGVKLRCPVCQGLSVADSTSIAAIQMQNRIRELVAAGYSEDQIEAYFVERYGEWVLLEPPFRNNLLIWLGPGLGVGLGLAWAAAVALKWRKEPDDVPLPSDVGLVPKDRYEQRLLAELEE
jgi:cytochrome c-type biogenesis protein CcmH